MAEKPDAYASTSVRCYLSIQMNTNDKPFNLFEGINQRL